MVELSRLYVTQVTKSWDFCDILISLEMENPSVAGSQEPRKWILLVGGAANQLLLSSRGSDALLATTWSRQLRVNAR
jgi:hypothetical protein